ncbi:hypothetical protein D6D85_00295 [Candidatus Methanodesulfokora washburnensis]|jgi:hypothetical protein|uniref:Uncharacterized protein n=1 Tax=Candidatus Methanodesulfokora washburnensis TaxID=2478471 RepID=A0A3R9PKN3_9CREN|nr:hypothetical protein D6D85_00295 [Candidatus Methanodesulfokores washburnensis]
MLIKDLEVVEYEWNKAAAISRKPVFNLLTALLKGNKLRALLTGLYTSFLRLTSQEVYHLGLSGRNTRKFSTLSLLPS